MLCTGGGIGSSIRSPVFHVEAAPTGTHCTLVRRFSPVPPSRISTSPREITFRIRLRGNVRFRIEAGLAPPGAHWLALMEAPAGHNPKAREHESRRAGHCPAAGDPYGGPRRGVALTTARSWPLCAPARAAEVMAPLCAVGAPSGSASRRSCALPVVLFQMGFVFRDSCCALNFSRFYKRLQVRRLLPVGQECGNLQTSGKPEVLGYSAQGSVLQG